MQTIDQVRAKIRANFPKERKPLGWVKVTDRIIHSKCRRFSIERRGDGDAQRFFAFILPDKVIGYRLLTADQARGICESHAAPLPPPTVDQKEFPLDQSQTEQRGPDSRALGDEPAAPEGR